MNIYILRWTGLVGVAEAQDGSQSDFYLIRPLEAKQCYSVAMLTADQAYHVDYQSKRCDCMAGLNHHQCRHLEIIQELLYHDGP